MSRALAKAIRDHADLATRYNALCAENFHRTDIVRAFPIVDGQPRVAAFVRSGEKWEMFAVMPDDTLRVPDRVMGLPVPETQKEWDRVALKQHRLHVRLHKATLRVRQLAEKAATRGSQ